MMKAAQVLSQGQVVSRKDVRIMRLHQAEGTEGPYQGAVGKAHHARRRGEAWWDRETGRR